MKRYTALFLAAGSLFVSAADALAHIHLTYPPSRYTDQKSGPCGRSADARSSTVTTLEPGETITVTWDETIGHPGHLRISFDDDGQDGFVDPTDYDDFDNNPTVLLDNIPDPDGTGPRSQQITLPDVECDNCTLQLIQVMSDKPPWGPEGGNEMYYQCADLVLSNSAPDSPDAGPGSPDAGTPGGGGGNNGDGGGCQAGSTGSQGTAGTALLVLAAAALVRRRRPARHRQ